jgi:flavin reductase (DIM6/NTAB) family NADH-FMN oxidoreductase RutF
MTEDARNLPGELLRASMRRWVTGVSIVTAQRGADLDNTGEILRHGMTVNSFGSISLDPPLVTVTLANDTRTHGLVLSAGYFGVTVLERSQEYLADIFAGKVPELGDRFDGVETFSLEGRAPLLQGGLAALECRVDQTVALAHSTLFLGEVIAAWRRDDGEPLVYYNRQYHRIEL